MTSWVTEAHEVRQILSRHSLLLLHILYKRYMVLRMANVWSICTSQFEPTVTHLRQALKYELFVGVLMAHAAWQRIERCAGGPPRRWASHPRSTGGSLLASVPRRHGLDEGGAVKGRIIRWGRVQMRKHGSARLVDGLVAAQTDELATSGVPSGTHTMCRARCPGPCTCEARPLVCCH